ncbi:unnamed protein product [Zymoseptoria tritici ST99CH_1A5]|uniref:F-box domain-containing protein n=1 Tax=Zymoseptoria tritici ST99CH_1A5 TaxID=1276529 RepID=A0A1Y6L9S7_ZYMTR|nr:unnamed protein product [Zymoseptoria tritici ST99CH_1A5]
MELPPLVAIFLVVFDQRKGYTITWQRAVSHVDLDGVEYRSLPSGLHSVDEDLVYFRHGEHVGASVFVRGEADAAHRNANFAAVGVLVSQHGALGQVWLHAEELRILARNVVGDVSDTGALESFWTKHKSQDTGDSSTAGSKKRKRAQSEATLAGLNNSAEIWPKDHPALAAPEVIDLFGPLLFPLHRAALARQRVLVMGSAPVQDAGNVLYMTSVLSTIPHALSESLPAEAGSLLRPLPLFSVGIHDIPTLPGSEDSNGWLAHTTDDILGEKKELWDLKVNLPSRLAPAQRWPALQTSDGRIVKATQRDLRRWKLLQRELKRLRSQIGGGFTDSGSMRSQPDRDQRPLLERGNTTASTYDLGVADRGDSEAVEAPTWTSVAYRGFMWWASAGDASAWENEESKADEELLFDMPDLGALSPDSGDGPEATDAEYARAAATLLVAYFRRVTEGIFRTMASSVEDADDNTEEGVAEEEILLNGDDVRNMGLDPWSAADKAWVEDMMKIWYGRDTRVSDGGIMQALNKTILPHAHGTFQLDVYEESGLPTLTNEIVNPTDYAHTLNTIAPNPPRRAEVSDRFAPSSATDGSLEDEGFVSSEVAEARGHNNAVFPAFHGPDELVLAIFDHVDLATVSILRHVSKNMRNFVDCFLKTICTSRMNAEIERITGSKDVLVDQLELHDPSVRQVLEIISCWVSKRGIWVDRKASVASLHLLAEYVGRDYEIAKQENIFGEEGDFAACYVLVLAILDLHIQHNSYTHLPYVRPVRNVAGFIKSIWRTGAEFEEELLHEIYEETMASHNLRQTAYVAGPTEAMKFRGVPQYALTPWKPVAFSSVPHTSSVKRMTELFALPDLPGDGIFAYGTNSRRIRDIIAFEVEFRRGLIPLALRALLLEYIVVF